MPNQIPPALLCVTLKFHRRAQSTVSAPIVAAFQGTLSRDAEDATHINNAPNALSPNPRPRFPITSFRAMSQLAASIRLLQNGAVLLTTAFSFGIFIPATKFPRIALATHVNLILHGLLSIAAGLVLRSGAVELEEWQVWLVAGAHFYSWVVNSVTACNAFWGASKTMPIVFRYACLANFSWPRSLELQVQRPGRRFLLKVRRLEPSF